MVVASLCAGSAALLVDTAIAQAPGPPRNDNYLFSLELNSPGKVLDSTHTLVDMPDTTNATTQANLFNPCGKANCPASQAEMTTYGGVTFGKTVWYDYYPNKNGLMDIKTANFDNVICVYQFSLKTFLPNPSTRVCSHRSSALAEEIVPIAKAHVAYTVQIGGVDDANGVPAGGPLQVTFDFVPAATPKLVANATVTAVPLKTGIRLVALNVSSPHATHIRVRCSSGCLPQIKKGGKSVNFPGLHNSVLPAGSKLEIFATKKSTIGAYIGYNIVKGNFHKITRCLEPGSMVPRTKCH